MTLSLHVVAHKATDVVLVAYTRNGGDVPDALDSVIGDKLPLAVDAVFELGDISAVDLVEAKVPGDASLAAQVLLAPTNYVIGRDAQGAPQRADLAGALTNVSTATAGKLTLDFPNGIENTGRAGLLRFVDATQTVYDSAL